jgi:predicted metal-dependent hydrolase
LSIFNQQIKLEIEEDERGSNITADIKKRSAKIYTLKDKIFEKADIEAVFAEKEAQKLKEQQKAAEEAKQKQNNLPRQTMSNMSNDLKQRITKDKQDKEQRSSGFFGFFGGSKDKDKEKERKLNEAKT